MLRGLGCVAQALACGGCSEQHRSCHNQNPQAKACATSAYYIVIACSARGFGNVSCELLFSGPNRWRRIGLMTEVHIA